MNTRVPKFLDKFVAWSITLSALTVFAGVGNYAIQLMVARLIDVKSYAIFGSIASVVMILLTSFVALGIVITKKLAELGPPRGEFISRRELFSIIKFVLGLTFGVIAIVYFLERYISNLLFIDSRHLLLAVLMFFVLSALSLTLRSIFQGLSEFLPHQLMGFSEIALKIIMLGGVFWGLSSTNLTIIFALFSLSILMTVVLFFVFVLRKATTSPTSRPIISAVSWKFYLSVLLSSGSFAAISQLDVALVNYMFAATEAGHYVAAAVIGKSVLYLPGGIVVALLPTVAKEHGEWDRSLAFKIASTTVLICVPPCIVFFLFAESIISVLYPATYMPAAKILAYYGFAMLPLALMLVFEFYLIAKGKVIFAFVLLLIGPLQAIALVNFTVSANEAMSVLFCSGVLAIISVFSALFVGAKIRRVGA